MKFIVVGVFLLLFAGVYYAYTRQPSPITSFDACEKAGYPVGESYPRQCWTPDGRGFVEEVGGLPLPGPITVAGEISCLPKVGSGPQTMECAIGLLSEDGRYYALNYPENFDPDYRYAQGGLRVSVSGTLRTETTKGPDGNRYDTAGVIDVTGVTVLGQKTDEEVAQ